MLYPLSYSPSARILTAVLYAAESVVQIREVPLYEEKHGKLGTDKAQLENRARENAR